jgi:hypothetical protein
MKCPRLALFFIVLVASFAVAPGLYAQELDPSDDFNDGVIDTARWEAYAEPGASIEETGGQILMSLPPSDWGEIDLSSTWRLRGAFDIQVDYQLLQWPASNGGRVGLLAMPANDWEWDWMLRTSGAEPLPESDELYLANVRTDHGCPCEGRTATSDTAGRLRLTRDADLNLTFYYWSNGTSEWVPIYQRTVPADDMQFRLTCWGPVTAPEGVVVAFDNFQVNSGELAPMPVLTDDFNDGAIDTALWYAGGEPAVEADGKVTMTLPSSDTNVEADLTARWKLAGPFDYQVDYELLEWPADRYAALGLLAVLPSDTWSNWSAQRASIDYGEPSWQCYLADYVPPPGDNDFIYGLTPTMDTAGTLRLARDENSVLTVSVRAASASDWTVIYSAPMSSDEVRPVVSCWTDGVAPVTVAFDNFRVYRGEVVGFAPTIEDVQIDRGRDTDWWDWARYHQRLTVQVKGTESEQPACLIIDDPDGSQFVISTCNPGGWYDWYVPNYGGFALTQLDISDDYTYTYTWYEGRKPEPLLAGSYQLTVIGNNGSQPTLTTPPAPEVPEEGPVLTGPAADSVITTTIPTFAWMPLPGQENMLQLRAEGGVNYTGPIADDAGEIWRASVNEKLAAVYNFYGSDPGPDLDPGRSYYWQVNSWTPVDDRVSDPRVSIWNEQTASHRFAIDTEWPPLPDLPGRLVFSQVQYGDWSQDFDTSNVVQYGSTIRDRQWIGPAASASPDISWDGAMLQYRICDTGTWIDDLHGTRARVPNQDSWSDSSLSPDATHILYLEATDPNWTSDAWTQKLDGSDRRLLVATRGLRISRPHWSPDGAWIAYTTCCDPSGYNVWLIRPDGTQDHPVIPTGVAGYPGWNIVWFANGSQWSPDAQRLVATFAAVSPDGSDSINALGTISRDGGEVTPMWVDPPGAICCAAAFPYVWSSDGNSIVFASGFHLTPDPEWANGKFEPGVELWMKNADGSGEPTRLTYDYSYPESAAWWAPNTLVGKGVSIVKGDASLTFAQVTAQGSTRMNVTFDAPGPEPAGYRFVSDIWSGETTASYQGDITVALKYDAGLAGQEDALALMEWNAEKGKWQNVTAHPIDVVSHVIKGQTKSLGIFAICLRTR